MFNRLEKSYKDDDVGVTIVAKRGDGVMPGFIKNPSCRIWVQQEKSRRMSGRMSGRRRAGKGQQ